jgi:hypothetical protein
MAAVDTIEEQDDSAAINMVQASSQWGSQALHMPQGARPGYQC